MWDIIVFRWLVPLLLRLGLAAIFIYHGLELIGPDKNWGTGWNPELPVPVQALVAWGELLGGVAMALGFLTRAAAVGLIVIMVGAIVTVHWSKGFSILNGGWEYNFAIIVMCLAVFLTSGGSLAVDWFFRLRRRA